jgi:AraC family transcriptional regulator
MEHPTTLEHTRKYSMKDVEYIMEFHNWILRNLDLPHSLDSLAEQTGFSISKMQRLFRAVFDISIIAFIRQQKLNRAKGQIEVTSMGIKVIAKEAGYRSLPAFTAAFAVAFGTTPAKLRRQVLK